MTARESVKAHPALVAVIASVADLHRATRLRRLPDLFELRLDALYPLPRATQQAIGKLMRPLIITARHPLEGGYHTLSLAHRRHLLLGFLPQAAYVDIELRASDQLRSVLEAAEERGARRIISVHDLRRTPPYRVLARLMHRAQELSADVLKIVTRTDTKEDLARLIAFFEDHKRQMPISAMGIGRAGREARIALIQRGSVLNFAHLGAPRADGQLSLAEALRKLGTP